MIIKRNNDEQLPLATPDLTDEWKVSELLTFSQRFVIRGFHTLDWVLQIDNDGINHSSILSYYNKILNAVN